MQLLSLPIAPRNAFSKGWQSWVPGLAIDENGMLIGSCHDHNCVVGSHLGACSSHHHAVNLDEHRKLAWKRIKLEASYCGSLLSVLQELKKGGPWQQARMAGEI